MLQDWRDGDASMLERLTPIVYAELHRIARRNLAGEREGHVLQPTALVNEAFVRLLGEAPVEWASRAHFFGFSARLMRQILIDIARAQDTEKRGHRSPHLGLSAAGDLRAQRSGATRRAPGEAGGTAVFRRFGERRARRGAGYFRAHRGARLARRARVALWPVAIRERTRRLGALILI